MKSSNPKVMIQAYRLLVERMARENMHYPLHLGVTEAGDGEDGRTPTFDGCEVLGRERLVRFGLDAEGGVEVLAHQRVFELRRLTEQVRQRLAILDDDRWFRRHCREKLAIRPPPSPVRTIGDPSPAGSAREVAGKVVSP